MNFVKSRWKLTFSPDASPLVILDFNELADDDLKPAGTSGVTVTPLIRSGTPHFLDQQNATYQIGFTVQRTLSTDALAGEALLDSLIAWAARGVAPLKLERAGVAASHWLFSRAKITAFTPRGRTIAVGKNLTEYQITCAGLSKVTPP